MSGGSKLLKSRLLGPALELWSGAGPEILHFYMVTTFWEALIQRINVVPVIYRYFLYRYLYQPPMCLEITLWFQMMNHVSCHDGSSFSSYFLIFSPTINRHLLFSPIVNCINASDSPVPRISLYPYILQFLLKEEENRLSLLLHWLDLWVALVSRMRQMEQCASSQTRSRQSLHGSALQHCEEDKPELAGQPQEEDETGRAELSWISSLPSWSRVKLSVNPQTGKNPAMISHTQLRWVMPH